MTTNQLTLANPKRPQLLHDLAIPGATFTHRLGADVIAATTLPIESIATYLEVLAAATDHGVLDPATHQLSVDALVNRWPDEDPRWTLLNHAA